jgi:hypothetical protein
VARRLAELQGQAQGGAGPLDGFAPAKKVWPHQRADQQRPPSPPPPAPYRAPPPPPHHSPSPSPSLQSSAKLTPLRQETPLHINAGSRAQPQPEVARRPAQQMAPQESLEATPNSVHMAAPPASVWSPTPPPREVAHHHHHAAAPAEQPTYAPGVTAEQMDAVNRSLADLREELARQKQPEAPQQQQQQQQPQQQPPRSNTELGNYAPPLLTTHAATPEPQFSSAHNRHAGGHNAQRVLNRNRDRLAAMKNVENQDDILRAFLQQDAATAARNMNRFDEQGAAPYAALQGRSQYVRPQ